MTSCTINKEADATLVNTEWFCEDPDLRGWLQAMTVAVLPEPGEYTPDIEAHIIDGLQALLDVAGRDEDDEHTAIYDIRVENKAPGFGAAPDPKADGLVF